jgi:hypothetical protein
MVEARDIEATRGGSTHLTVEDYDLDDVEMLMTSLLMVLPLILFFGSCAPWEWHSTPMSLRVSPCRESRHGKLCALSSGRTGRWMPRKSLKGL